MADGGRRSGEETPAAAVLRRLPFELRLLPEQGRGGPRVPQSRERGRRRRGAIAYSVLTASSVRRRGVGRFLMARAEAEAAARGFTFLYLFTPDMREFYEACGYEVCERIAALGAVSRHVDAAAPGACTRPWRDGRSVSPPVAAAVAVVAAAERHPGTKTRAAKEMTAARTKEKASRVVVVVVAAAAAVAAAVRTVAGADSVWLRKALVESTPAQPTKRSDDADALVEAARRRLSSSSLRKGILPRPPRRSWKAFAGSCCCCRRRRRRHRRYRCRCHHNNKHGRQLSLGGAGTGHVRGATGWKDLRPRCNPDDPTFRR